MLHNAKKLPGIEFADSSHTNQHQKGEEKLRNVVLEFLCLKGGQTGDGGGILV
jgi:hypothetical protein